MNDSVYKTMSKLVMTGMLCFFALSLSAMGASDANPKTDEQGEGGGTQDPTKGGDPISITSGEVLKQATDIVIPCPLIDLVFIRNYGSNLTDDIPLGYRWTHSYDWRVKEFTGEGESGQMGDWILLRAISNPWVDAYAGMMHWFKKQADGSYILAGNSSVKMKKLETGYEATVAGAIKYLFDTKGVLQTISHVAGQRVVLSYEGVVPAHKLTRVEHSNGKYLAFTYTNNCISHIATPSPDLSVSYLYNAIGELTNVVKHTSRGDLSTRYEYNAIGE